MEDTGLLQIKVEISKEYDGITGRYIDNDKGETKGSFGDAHSMAYNQDAVKSLIDLTESIVKSKI